MTFRERYMKHEAEFDEIFTLTDKWNFSDEPCTLREYLGLTADEEDIWISQSDEALEELMMQERENQTKRNILFTDLDGTLLNDKKEITPGNQAAIDEALSMGHIIVISTGRPLVSAYIQAQRLGLTREGCYAITYNGAQIYDCCRQKTVYGKGLPHTLARPLFDAASARGLHIQTYNDTHVLAEHDTPELRRYSEVIHIPYQVVGHIEDAVTEDPYKFLIIDSDHEKLVTFQNEVLSGYSDLLVSFFSNDSYLEIVPRGISKGFAVRWMCEYLNVPLENSVAAGDAQNDIAMLEAAHTGAVMRNAFPDIFQHGDYITEADNNHDGVAEIIRRFIL